MISLVLPFITLFLSLLITLIICLKKYVYTSFLDKLDSFSNVNDLILKINSFQNDKSKLDKIKSDQKIMFWVCNTINTIPIISNYTQVSLGRNFLKYIKVFKKNYFVFNDKKSQEIILKSFLIFLKNLLIDNTDIKISNYYYYQIIKIICDKLDNNDSLEDSEITELVTIIGVIITGTSIENNFKSDNFEQLENLPKFQNYFSKLAIAIIKFFLKNKNKILLNRKYGDDLIVLMTNCTCINDVLLITSEKFNKNDIDSLLEIIHLKLSLCENFNIENISKLIYNLSVYDVYV